MNERVIEIIVYIVNEMHENHSIEDGDGFKSLSQKLSKDGYSENEISFAFSWILDKFDEDQQEKSKNAKRKSQRILHDFEKIAISPAAHGYLIQLKEFDLIDNIEMEQIIERALLSSSEDMVSLLEMKRIVSATIFKPEDIMDGSFFLLDNSFNVH